LKLGLLLGFLALEAASLTLDDTKLQGEVVDDLDAVVVEGVESGRMGRQLKSQEDILSQLGVNPIKPPQLGQPCLSKEEGIGRCMSLKSCYPYFKLPNFGASDTWVMGLYDTCSYMGPQGRTVFGVCCNNTVPENLPKETPSPVQIAGDDEDVEEEEDETVDHDKEAIIEEFPLDFQLAAPGAPQCGARTVRPIPTLYSLPGPLGSPWARQMLFGPGFRIVNGVEAIPHEFPFMAVLLNRNRQFCGGSLIDQKHILTAAHCVAHMSKYDVQNLRVRLGDHNIHQDSDSTHTEKRVKRVIRHKGFSSSTLWNDVAILTMEDDVEFTPNIQPICLAEGSSSYVDNIVTVAGWGTLKEGGKQPSVLMKVDVKVWTNERCKTSYGSNAPGGITSHMMCASDTNRDSCSGDSGGPLFTCPWGGRCTQIGIVSWGIGCAKPQYPGVYTRVTQMLEWIQRIVDEY